MTNPEEILKTIQTKNIHPKPKIFFWAKYGLFWLLSAIALFFGSLSFSTLVFIIANQDWDIYPRFNLSPISFCLTVLPYFWLVFLIIFAIVGYFNFRHTKRGYKISLLLIIFVYLIITILSGYTLYQKGWGQKLEQLAADQVPYYNQMIKARDIWSQHKNGLLAGKILDIKNNFLEIIDLDGEKWRVNISSTTGQQYIYSEKDIKIIGNIVDDGTFQADEIRPWCGCNGCAKHQGVSCLDHCQNKNAIKK